MSKKYIEIRPAAGGEESTALMNEMIGIYSKYCTKHNIQFKILDDNKRVSTMIIEGKDKYVKAFNNETGVHKFQRVPKTEKRGRVHTSTITVAVLDISENTQIKKYYNDKDIKIDEFRASGAGGQHVNKTSSAIRVTHKPSGIVVTCQNERSQYRNKETALAVLNMKLKERLEQDSKNQIENIRSEQISDGMRNKARRIYNEQRNEIVDNILNQKKRYKEFFKGELFNEN